jgi:predicted DNA binding CopG/RHH family protein
MTRKKKIDPRDYVITPDTEISTIDLDHEEFILPDGRRLTEELAEQLARDAGDEIRRRNLIPGRKSLSGDGQHSPTIRVRVPEQLREQAQQRAATEGVSLSALTREALEHYLAS